MTTTAGDLDDLDESSPFASNEGIDASFQLNGKSAALVTVWDQGSAFLIGGVSNANILAVCCPEGKTFTNLGGDFVLVVGDVMIALGTPEQLESLAGLADDQRQAH